MTFTLGDIGIFSAIIASLSALMYFIFRSTVTDGLKVDIGKLNEGLEKEKGEILQKRIECTKSFTRLEDLPRRVDKLTERVDDLSGKFDKMSERMDDLSGRFDKMGDKMDKIGDVLFNLSSFLRSKFKDAPMGFSLTHSPRSLSDTGRELYEVSGAKNILEQNLDKYIAKLESFNLKSAFDVEDKSATVLYSLFEDDEFLPIKNYLYNNPIFNNESIGIPEVCFVMSLPLRDKYLEKHPEISSATA